MGSHRSSFRKESGNGILSPLTFTPSFRLPTKWKTLCLKEWLPGPRLFEQTNGIYEDWLSDNRMNSGCEGRLHQLLFMPIQAICERHVEAPLVQNIRIPPSLEEFVLPFAEMALPPPFQFVRGRFSAKLVKLHDTFVGKLPYFLARARQRECEETSDIVQAQR
jgi:hypothetical protein